MHGVNHLLGNSWLPRLLLPCHACVPHIVCPTGERLIAVRGPGRRLRVGKIVTSFDERRHVAPSHGWPHAAHAAYPPARGKRGRGWEREAGAPPKARERETRALIRSTTRSSRAPARPRALPLMNPEPRPRARAPLRRQPAPRWMACQEGPPRVSVFFQ